VNRCVNLGWGVFNVEKELSGRLDNITVKAGNDANVAALGEMWKGGGQGYRNVVMITLGTGVGGGIIIGGKILPGSFGAAGEIGHFKVSKTETECCGCGKKGCLEQYASATGIVRKAKQILKDSKKPSVLREIENLSAKDIFDAAKDQDELSLELVEFLGETLGTAMSYIACVVDPQVFVLGGGVSKAGSILVESVRRYYKETAFHASREAKFALATLGNDAGMYGAVKLVIG
jgi:glucokinase